MLFEPFDTKTNGKHSAEAESKSSLFAKIQMMIFFPHSSRSLARPPNQQNIIWREQAALKNFPHFLMKWKFYTAHEGNIERGKGKETAEKSR
jgi:hypothetical protein